MRALAWTTGIVSSWILCGALAAAEPPNTDSHADDTSVYARQRQLVREAGQLRRLARERLQKEARTEGVRNLHAVDDLIDVYIALRLDRALTDGERQRLAGKVRSRLLRVQERLRKQFPDSGQASADPAPPGASGLQSEAQDAAERTVARDRLAEHAARRTAANLAHLSHHVLAQQGFAGPVGAAAAGAIGAQPLPPDYGPDLVELIETVIAPATWERNGGPGSIYYYRPLRVLVIRQTGEVHHEVGGVIEDLRQAGN